MKRETPENIQDILNKCEGNSLEIKHFQSLLALKDYENLKRCLKEDFYLKSSEINILINYYKSLSYKRKLTEINYDQLNQRYALARKKVDDAKSSGDGDAYDKGLDYLNESYIFFVGDKLIESCVTNRDGVLCLNSSSFDDFFVPVEKADQVFLVEWI